MRKKRTSIVVAIVVITGAVVFVMWPGGKSHDARSDDESQVRGERSSQMGKVEEELERSSVRRSERGAAPSPGKPSGKAEDAGFDLMMAVNPSPQVTKSASEVVWQVLDDEAARTQLISEERKDGIIHYRFETSRRADYREYLDGLLRKEAGKAGVDMMSVKAVAVGQITHLDIPEGYRQMVEIRVPLDPNERVKFSSAAMKPDDIGKTGKILFQNMSAGSVPIGSKAWRYSRLLDMGNP